MSDYKMSIEKGTGEMWSVKICDEEGNLYRYFASVSGNLKLLEKIKEYFDMGDISILHIDDIICDILYLKSE